MKKDLWNRAKSFVFFDSPVEKELIDNFFNSTHLFYQQEDPQWTYAATKNKLIYKFWVQEVSRHFTLVLISAVLGILFITRSHHIFLQSLAIATTLSFAVVAVKIYWPAYFSDFLPKLNNIIAEKERILLAEQELNKCRRSQYSTPTLTIIYYVNCKVSGISLLPANDSSAELLNQLYGVDKDKIKQNLTRLYRMAKLSVREKAEMRKGIDNARDFFAKQDHRLASPILDQLELKLAAS